MTDSEVRKLWKAAFNDELCMNSECSDLAIRLICKLVEEATNGRPTLEFKEGRLKKILIRFGIPYDEYLMTEQANVKAD